MCGGRNGPLLPKKLENTTNSTVSYSHAKLLQHLSVQSQTPFQFFSLFYLTGFHSKHGLMYHIII